MNRELELAIDREIDNQIEYQELLGRAGDTYNFDEEMENYEEPCCDLCTGQAAYYLKRG